MRTGLEQLYAHKFDEFRDAYDQHPPQAGAKMHPAHCKPASGTSNVPCLQALCQDIWRLQQAAKLVAAHNFYCLQLLPVTRAKQRLQPDQHT